MSDSEVVQGSGGDGKVEVPLSFGGRAMKMLVVHCESEAPREACGVLLGIGDMVMSIRALKNVAKGNHHYEIEHEGLLAVHQECEKEDYWDVLGYYHSHPASSSGPSELDREMALPGYVYVVLGQDGSVSTFQKG